MILAYLPNDVALHWIELENVIVEFQAHIDDNRVTLFNQFMSPKES